MQTKWASELFKSCGLAWIGEGGDLGDCGRRWQPSGCLVPRAEWPGHTVSLAQAGHA